MKMRIIFFDRDQAAAGLGGGSSLAILRMSFCHNPALAGGTRGDHTVRAAINGGLPVRDIRENDFFSRDSVNSAARQWLAYARGLS